MGLKTKVRHSRSGKQKVSRRWRRHGFGMKVSQPLRAGLILLRAAGAGNSAGRLRKRMAV